MPGDSSGKKTGKLEVIETLAEVMLWRGIPEYIRSDNGAEFVAKELRKWLGSLGTGTLYKTDGMKGPNSCGLAR